THFRTENAGRLPDQLQSNLQAMNALESQLASVGETLNRNSQEKMALETRLQNLKSQISFYSSMGSNTPDVPVATTHKQVVKNARLEELSRRIVEGESQLASLKE